MIQGRVLDAAGKPVSDASVSLGKKGSTDAVVTKTNLQGAFIFSALRPGSYLLSAEKSGLRAPVVSLTELTEGEDKRVNLVLESSGNPQSNVGANSPEPMQFADQPNFTVAGVTDWTAVGGHGSDSILRTSETLARETLKLQPQDAGHGAASLREKREAEESENKLRTSLAASPESFEANHQLGEFYFHSGRYGESIPLLKAAYRIDPANQANEYDLALAYKEAGELSQAKDLVQKMLAHQDRADLHRLSGELDEKLGDPLAAVNQYERAVRLDPSEQNYFEWGSELLLHRAVWQAQNVFAKGAEAHPQSARMLTGLGAALFASGLYDQAALRLCDASDLNTVDAAPYEFLGKIELVAPKPLPCVEQKLERFLREQPGNALANYYYAISLWKRQGPVPNQQELSQAETLLTKAVTINPKCGDAYLQLGIISSSQRNTPKAIGYYTKAIEANPQLGDAYYRLGVAYDRSGESAKAKEQFQLHDVIEKKQAADIERQRKEVKQFLVVLQDQPASPPSH